MPENIKPPQNIEMDKIQGQERGKEEKNSTLRKTGTGRHSSTHFCFEMDWPVPIPPHHHLPNLSYFLNPSQEQFKDQQVAQEKILSETIQPFQNEQSSSSPTSFTVKFTTTEILTSSRNNLKAVMYGTADFCGLQEV